MKSAFLFVLTFVVLSGAIAFARTMFGAEVGEPCNDFILSCRATRGVLSVNACVRTGPRPEDTFCSYACDITSDCPERWECDPASAWSSVPGAADDVVRVCHPPR